MDGRFDLLLITDDSRVTHQRLHILRVELRDLGKGELRESLLEIRPFILDHTPVKTGCENGLGQSFKVFSVIFRWFHTPRRHVTSNDGFAIFMRPAFPGQVGLT